MDDKSARGALLRGDLVFVGPSSVIGHRFVAENTVDGRIVDEHDEHFAADVDVFVIVPIIFGRDRAISHEDELPIE